MTYKTKALVLKTIAWPRNAQLYILYSERFGKVKAAAAGVTKIKSKVAGHLQPFCLTEVMLARGRSIDRLAQARLVRTYPVFTKDFQSLVCGSYLLELLDVITDEGVADQDLWQAILGLLHEMEAQVHWQEEGSFVQSSEFLLRIFTLQALQLFGARPECDHCVHCSEPLIPVRLHFSFIQGGVICADCSMQFPEAQPVSRELVTSVRFALQYPLTDVARLSMTLELKEQFMRFVDTLLQYQLQRPLKSMQSLDAMKTEQCIV